MNQYQNISNLLRQLEAENKELKAENKMIGATSGFNPKKTNERTNKWTK